MVQGILDWTDDVDSHWDGPNGCIRAHWGRSVRGRGLALGSSSVQDTGETSASEKKTPQRDQEMCHLCVKQLCVEPVQQFLQHVDKARRVELVRLVVLMRRDGRRSAANVTGTKGTSHDGA